MPQPILQTICSRWPTLLIALFFCAVAILLQNALVPITHWASATLGYDAIMQTYLLSWGSHSLLVDPANFYNPPIFFPDHNVAQSTDGLELPALLMTPLWILTKNPYLLANGLIVISHFFAMAAAYFVARRQFALNRIIAVLIAILFAMTSDRLWHSTGHFNLIWSGILPLAWYFTWRLIEKPERRSAIMLAITLAISIYFSVYFFVLSGLCIGGAVLASLLINGRRLSQRSLITLGAGFISGGIIALPKIAIYAYASHGVETVRNTLAEATLYSANWAGYLLPTQPESGLARLTGWGTGHGSFGENGQFLGYTLYALLVWELTRLGRQLYQRNVSRADKLSLTSLGLGFAIVLCSFGPDFYILGVSPYRLLYYPILQFTGFFRVPARLAFVAQWLFLVSACTFFSQVRINTHRTVSAAVAALILPLVYFEHVPLTHPPLIEKTNGHLLAAMDKRDPSHTEPYMDIRPDMGLRMALENIPNWRPTANGWLHAALAPEFDQRALAFTEDFPSTTTIGWLATNGVPWVIVHGPERRRILQTDTRFELLTSTPDASIFHLRNLEKAKSDYQEYRKQTASALSALRAETPASLHWPETPLVRVVPELAMPFDPATHQIELKPGSTLPPSELTEFLKAPPTFWFSVQPAMPFPPGLYDQVTVEYKLDGPPTKHRAHIYWGTAPNLKNTRRLKADVDKVKENGNHWKATFDVSENKNWTTDPTANWILIELDRFKGTPPVSVQITAIHLNRKM